eukprot:364320-Chlamydomonas_euryale.AAC.7
MTCAPASCLRRAHRYGYSRDHGSQMLGKGVGVPLAECMVRMMGGTYRWTSTPGQGSVTVIEVPRDGDFSI